MLKDIAIEGAFERAESRSGNDLSDDKLLSAAGEEKNGWKDWSDWNDYPDFPNWDDAGDGPRY